MPLDAKAAADALAREQRLKARAQDLRRAGKAGSGVGRERAEMWLKMRSEECGIGEEENAAMAGQKMDGERTPGGAESRRERDDGEAGRREMRARRKAGWWRRPCLARSAWSWWPAAALRGERRRTAAAGVLGPGAVDCMKPLGPRPPLTCGNLTVTWLTGRPSSV
jgi:hypothetical protein